MSIVGIQESFIDYPNQICIMLFTNKCSWDCTKCHNKHNLSVANPLSTSEVIEYLKESLPLIKHVTISGGEPTEDCDIINLVKEVHDLGFKIKLDTNGSHPDILKQLLPYLSVVAMDIKDDISSYEKYTNICKCTPEDYANVKVSLEMLSEWCKSSDDNYLLLRTTLLDECIDPEVVKSSISMYSYDDYVIQSEII